MTLTFRNNPKITTNWENRKTKEFSVDETKRAYYDMSTKTKGKLVIGFREEKKRLGGSKEEASNWYSSLSFELDTQFVKDLKMFLNEFVEEDAEEIKNTVRIYFEKGKWCARQDKETAGFGLTKKEALTNLCSILKAE